MFPPSPFPPGTVVGAGRWPGNGPDPEHWAEPWTGVVLARDDPQAWIGSLAFPAGPLAQVDVSAHVAAVSHLLQSKLPVLWTFGRSKKVYWEPVSGLSLAEDEKRAWLAARQQATAA